MTRNACSFVCLFIRSFVLFRSFCFFQSGSPTPWQDAWRELEKFYREGAVQAIGVSNFSANLLRELLEMAVVTPAAVQNWMDPFHQDREVRALCSENGELWYFTICSDDGAGYDSFFSVFSRPTLKIPDEAGIFAEILTGYYVVPLEPAPAWADATRLLVTITKKKTVKTVNALFVISESIVSLKNCTFDCVCECFDM